LQYSDTDGDNKRKKGFMVGRYYRLYEDEVIFMEDDYYTFAIVKSG